MGRLAEVGIDEGWRIEWIPGSWVSHQRCAGWLGGKAEFAVSGRKKITDANIHLTGSLYLDIFRESMHNKGIINLPDRDKI